MTDDIYNHAFVAALFDRCSERYRRWSAVSSFGLAWLWRRQCVDRLHGQSQIARIQNGQVTKQAQKCPQVVDLMSGTGEVWPHVFDAFPRAQISAIDISQNMHAHAVTRLNQSRSRQINHFEANALDTDLPASSADMVVATFGLKTFNADQQTVLAHQISRILREGGCFSLIEASDPKGWLLRPLYRAYLDRALPLLERVFLHGAQDFNIIGTYTKNFGDCRHMAVALHAAGLNVTFKRHFFGCATSVAGTKPIAPDAPAP